jgi:predicted alpha/beta hydrolase family esterase
MANAFIFHGTNGYPEENWFPWLKEKLGKLNCTVFVPRFPTPENQTLENWFKVFEKYKNNFNSETILIGHSLGGAFLLRVLEKTEFKIKAAIIVSAPVGIKPIKNWEGDQPFIGKPFNLKKIKNSCQKFFVFHSDNDPYVGIGNGKETAKKLGAKLIFVPNAGHFNKAAGYTKFELLLEKIKKEL